MSDYKPGTVAMVTYDGARRKAFRGERDTWAFWDGGWRHSRADGFSDISPLVVLDLTRDLADRIDEWLPEHVGHRPTPDCPIWLTRLLSDTRDAIREQVPAPEPPKRWGIDYSTGSGCAGASVAFTEHGQRVGKFDRLDVAERVIDALNAAEQTGDE